MKHRSTIAFVIVAAALFAAPQLSHDLQTLRSALGSRLSGELMQAFLSLPSAEGAAAAVAPQRAETQLASSCTKERPAAKQRKNDPAPATRAEVRAPESAGDRLAMIGEPLPVSEPWSAALPGGALIGAAELPHKSLAEVAMIIPPDSGIDPKGRALAKASGMYRDAAQSRRLTEQVRLSYVATRLNAKGGEWRKVEGGLREEDLRELEKTLPGSFEFQLDRDDSKTKVLKVKRGTATCCPLPAPRAPRPASVDAAAAPLPAVAALTALASE
ncbi:MAG TPA: hypothetical protein VFZ44_20435 [Pyrinomonadaceae bacterium]